MPYCECSPFKGMVQPFFDERFFAIESPMGGAEHQPSVAWERGNEVMQSAMEDVIETFGITISLAIQREMLLTDCTFEEACNTFGRACLSQLTQQMTIDGGQAVLDRFEEIKKKRNKEGPK